MIHTGHTLFTEAMLTTVATMKAELIFIIMLGGGLFAVIVISGIVISRALRVLNGRPGKAEKTPAIPLRQQP